MTNQNQAVERLKKIGLSITAAENLAERGISSAIHLAMLTQSKLEELTEDIELDGETVIGIHKKAKLLKQIVDNHVVTIRGQVSPFYQALASTNAKNNIINFHQGLESYTDMFGSLEYAECPEFASVLSPAAYLVDLMRYIDEYIIQPEDTALQLVTRRPDIGSIPLNIEETVDEVPYLQIVNEVLEEKIVKDRTGQGVTDALLSMAEAVYPFNVPFNAPLEKIRTYLEALNSELYEVYQTFHAGVDAQNREYLRLSPEQVNYFSTARANPNDLSEAYGYIDTSNPAPHFTGVESDTEVGNLNNADVLMTQVGFDTTDQLKSLLYQSIELNTPGTDVLLQGLFINQKTKSGSALSIQPAPEQSPSWADSSAWSDASYYKTIQTVYFNGKLLLVVRTADGIETWEYDSSYQQWYQLGGNSTDWTDANGWNQEEYYSTIQTAVVNNTLLLLAMSDQGISIYYFDDTAFDWNLISDSSIDWSPASGWGDPEYYFTIKAIVADSELYVLGRDQTGHIETQKLVGLTLGPTPIITWKIIGTTSPPALLNTGGWNLPEAYSTVQYVVLNDNIHLVGRAVDGMHTWILDTSTDTWGTLMLSPILTDAEGWKLPAYYSTIQCSVISELLTQRLYLIARSENGILTYEWMQGASPLVYIWSPIKNQDIPAWTDAEEWNQPEYYETIQTAYDVNISFLLHNFYLFGRYKGGMQMYNYLFLGLDEWVLAETNVPGWSDVAGWNDPAFYSTIQTVLVNKDLYMIGCNDTGIMTWKYDDAKNTWNKETPIRATVQPLDMDVLDLLNRFIRLADSIKWSYEDLDWVLKSFEAEDISEAAISSLKNTQWIAEQLEVTIPQATVFWHDIKTYGVGSGLVSAALFDKIFNEPTAFLTDGGQAITYHPAYTPNPNFTDTPITWDSQDQSTEENKKIAARLMAGLNLDATNFEFLINYLQSLLVTTPGATTIDLTIPNMSLMYRYALLSNSLKLTIQELTILMALLNLGKSACLSPEVIVEIITQSQWVQSNKLDLLALEFICNGIEESSINPSFDLDGVPDLLKNLSTAAKAWTLNPKELQFGLMTKELATAFYNTLAKANCIDDRGVLLKNSFDFNTVSGFFHCQSIRFVPNHLFSLFSAGASSKGDPSVVSIASSDTLIENLSSGSLGIWFQSNTIQKGNFTLFSIFQSKTELVEVLFENGNMVLNDNTTKTTIGTLPNDSDWHFLLLSFNSSHVGNMDIDEVASGPGLGIYLDNTLLKSISTLAVPSKFTKISIGTSSDNYYTPVAQISLFDSTASADSINTELYVHATNIPGRPLPGNTNYWPLSDGEGALKASDIIGDQPGQYSAASLWEMLYNYYPEVTTNFPFLNDEGSLMSTYDPQNANDDNLVFNPLWSLLIKLRNILNQKATAQKDGTLQKLNGYYQSKRNLEPYADLVSVEDQYPDYIQTLLTFRFSLNWEEYVLDLDNATPFISSNLRNQFHSNQITLSTAAVISREKDKSGNLLDHWHVADTESRVYLINKRDAAIDIYKLLPEQVNLVDKDHLEEMLEMPGATLPELSEGVPYIYKDSDLNKNIVLVKRGEYIHRAVYAVTTIAPNDVLSTINIFITDLGTLLFATNSLGLTDAEFSCVVDNPNRFFGSTAGGHFKFLSFPNFAPIILLKNLNRTYTSGDFSFTDYFYQADDRDSLNDIAKLTGWNADGLLQLSDWHFQEFDAMETSKVDDTYGQALAVNDAFAAVASAGMIYTYELQGDDWSSLASIKAPSNASGKFGTSIAIEYDELGKLLNLAIGDPQADSGAGSVYTYSYDFKNGKWLAPVVLSSPNPISGDFFGSSLVISSGVMAVGAPGASSKVGQVLLFQCKAAVWSSLNFAPTIPSAQTGLGKRLSLSGDFIAIATDQSTLLYNIKNASKVIVQMDTEAFSIATNGSMLAVSGTKGGRTAIQYVTDISSASPLSIKELTNVNITSLCSLAIEYNTLLLLDTSNACHVYGISGDTLVPKPSFALPGDSSQMITAPLSTPSAIAMNSDNILLTSVGGINPKVFFYGIEHNIGWFGYAQKCFNVADKLGVSISYMLDFISLANNGLTLPTTKANSEANEQAFLTYQAYASKLKNALQLGRSASEWDSFYAPLESAFLEGERDALTQYMIWYLRGQFTDITNLNDLYELLLIDVASSGCRSISRVKAALNSLQLYIERCRLHLEPGVTLEASAEGESDGINAADVEWSWMSHYRVWEANRQVFLYPENYYEPGLRKDKTPIYKDLQDKLSQGDLNDDSADTAFQSYFTDLEQLTSLEVVSTLAAYTASFVNGSMMLNNTFYVFAKSLNSNGGYYYRSAQSALIIDPATSWNNWTSWTKLDLSITSEQVTAIYANNRVFIFWMEFTKQMVTGTDSTFSTNKKFNYQGKIYYAFQKANGQWSSAMQIPDPQNSLDFEVCPTAAAFTVNIPAAPQVSNLIQKNSAGTIDYLDAYELLVTVSVTGGTVGTVSSTTAPTTSPLTVSINISDILNLHDRYMWPLIGTASDLLNENTLFAVSPLPAGITFPPITTGIFKGKKVLDFSGYKGAVKIQFPSIVGSGITEDFDTFFNRSFTFGIWVNGDFSTNPNCPILCSTPTTPFLVANEQLSIQIQGQKAIFSFYGSQTEGEISIPDNQWVFLVFRYDEREGVQSIFVNGKLDQQSFNIPALNNNSPVSLGMWTDLNNTTYADKVQMSTIFATTEAFTDSKVYTIYEQYQSNPDPQSQVDILNTLQAQYGRAIQKLNQDLVLGGPDYFYGNNAPYINSTLLSSQSPYGKYYWELFYHIPMLVAQLLSGNQKFEDAKGWYEYIFNPTAGDTSNDRFWQLGYFRSLGAPEDIIQILTDSSQQVQDQITLYDLDPFDPEAIAYLRPGAFEKKTVMSYVKNLLDWGDSLFSQYTWESLTQAEMLYILSKELLGKRPELSGRFTEPKPIDLNDIEVKYQEDIPQFLIDLEDMQPSLHPKVQVAPALSGSLSGYYFCIPENSLLPANYDLVDTRLFDIRHCLNIKGQEQSLALFQPPIDPMALVGAGASGLSFGNVPIGLGGSIPYYRFSKMIEYAKGINQRVIDFGRQILSALEKSDAESLSMLRSTQELGILNLTTSIKERNIQDLTEQVTVLQSSLDSANTRVSYYTGLLAQPVSPLEAAALALNAEAIVLEIPAVELHVAAAIGHLVPTVFGFADGDLQPGSAIEAGASALSTASGLMNNTANMTSISASYIRRAEDWGLQLKLAQNEVSSLNVQLQINQIHLQNAQSELSIHQQNIADNQKIQNFYQQKFTNLELYQWMLGQISTVYYQSYNMAFDLAKKSEAAYHFELNTSDAVITYGYWDSRKKGLLAGEKLALDLDRLEKAYIDEDVRYLEIQKVVSLNDLDPLELNRLITTGKCYINLKEQLYDHDFPGHYNRKIKSVSISIPAVVGPYQTIKASLAQQSNYVVMRPDIDTVKYLIAGEPEGGTQPPEYSLRQNWKPNQEIAVSKASGDTGLFELNFNDSRYLPFEGTGAVSNWELNIPQSTNQFKLSSISDIILYVNYTAQDGGTEFQQQVSNLPEIKSVNSDLVVSLKQQFNKAWNTLLATATSDSISMATAQFAANVENSGAANMPKIPESSPKEYDITLLIRSLDGYVPASLTLTNHTKSPGTPNSWSSKSGLVDAGDSSLIDEWIIEAGSPIDATKLLDIILIIPYTGQLVGNP